MSKPPILFHAEDFIRPNQYGDAVLIIAKADAETAQAIFEKWWIGERCKEKQLAPIDPVTMRQNLGRGKDEDDNIHSHYENGEDDCPLCCKDAYLREQREDDDGN